MNTKERILQLLKDSGEIYSGEKLAQELKVSRTAIWKAIKELEKAGYRFDHTATGYRYLPSDQLDATAITGAVLPNLQVEISDHSDSTMKEAKLAVAEGKTTPRLFITETQTGGHGRFGRPFFSPRGQGIYMTMLLNPNHTFEELPQYTLLAAVAVYEAIKELTGKEVAIKWVNDIYFEGRKLCGILSEATSDFESGTISHVSIGMGLNFSTPQEEFPAELQAKATSLFPDGEPSISRNQLIQQIWVRFFDLLAKLPNMDYLETYRQRSFVLGKQVSFVQQGQTISGIAEAITDEGQLVVRTPEQVYTLNSGEISLTAIEG